MPITQSAKKALRQSKRRHVQNVARQNALHTAIKSYKKFIAEKKAAEAKTALAQVYKALDKAAKSNAISRNKASRLKSRLSLKLATPPAPRMPS